MRRGQRLDTAGMRSGSGEFAQRACSRGLRRSTGGPQASMRLHHESAQLRLESQGTRVVSGAACGGESWRVEALESRVPCMSRAGGSVRRLGNRDVIMVGRGSGNKVDAKFVAGCHVYEDNGCGSRPRPYFGTGGRGLSGGGPGQGGKQLLEPRAGMMVMILVTWRSRGVAV